MPATRRRRPVPPLPFTHIHTLLSLQFRFHLSFHKPSMPASHSLSVPSMAGGGGGGGGGGAQQRNEKVAKAKVAKAKADRKAKRQRDKELAKEKRVAAQKKEKVREPPPTA